MCENIYKIQKMKEKYIKQTIDNKEYTFFLYLYSNCIEIYKNPGKEH